MSPFLPRTYAFLDGRSANGTEPPATPTKNQRVVFILCIVFGSLLVCALAATAIYLTRRWAHKRQQAKVMALHRDASFLAGTPSVMGIVGAPLTTPAQTKRPRRGRTRTTSGPLSRLALPSPELGSVFRLDSTLLRSVSGTTTPATTSEPLPPSEPMPALKPTSPRNRPLFSNGSTHVGSPPFDKYDMPLRTLSKQSMSSSASSQRTGKAVEVESPYLTGLDYTPFVLPTVRESSPPPPLGRYHSADEVLRAPSGVPVRLSHFPFRFSHKPTSSPSIPPTSLPPVPGSNIGAQNPAAAHSSPNVPSSPRRGLGFMNNNASAWTLPHSTSSLKLKIRHAASDEIIAIAFAPHTVNYRAVRDAIRARLGFRPRRIWSEEGNVEITDDTSLWSWLDEQYTRGHTRLILQAE
ncbi:hypothetical protein FRC06_005584 [Ceratobasidium sp. 370]|nr:hypothetical protein FRC06_005584 [Ceratobasidium sp. 370]